jgi:hypothetical protein
MLWRFAEREGITSKHLAESTRSRLTRPAPGTIASCLCLRLAEVKHDAVWISNVASRDRWVLLQHRAARGDQLAFCGLNVGHQELKNRPVLLALLDIQTESARLKAHERFAPVRDGQAQHRRIKMGGLRPTIGSDDDIAGRSKLAFHSLLS